MLSSLFIDYIASGNFTRALEEFDVNEDGLIDYGEFIEIERRYPMILFPAFRLQDVMQTYSLGSRAWVKLLEKYNYKQQVEEYKIIHDGKMPPEEPIRDCLKYVFPGLFSKRVYAAIQKSH